MASRVAADGSLTDADAAAELVLVFELPGDDDRWFLTQAAAEAVRDGHVGQVMARQVQVDDLDPSTAASIRAQRARAAALAAAQPIGGAR